MASPRPLTRAPEILPPPDLRVALSPDAQTLDAGRLLIGGSPMQALRLTPAGVRAVSRWTRPASIGAEPAGRALARRLLDGDLLMPCPEPVESSAQLTVVVPVRNRAAQLARCLDHLARTSPESPVVVVDDGSEERAGVCTAAATAGARIVRHPQPQGAASARNSGLAVATTPLVAFVDSDVVAGPAWAHGLLGHFDDPRVGAVAPRVRTLDASRGAIAAYESRHSPLDMGVRPRSVGPGRRTAYVPSAVLIVRREAVGDGFDPALDIGEDVDLVWRLSAAGWTVRYDPGRHVWHEDRHDWRAFAARRRVYARSVAALAARHPTALPAIRTRPAPAIVWLALLSGRPRAAACAASVATARLGWRLRPVAPRPYALAAMLLGRSVLDTGAGLSRAVRRAWLPLLVPLTVRSRIARRVLLGAVATVGLDDSAARGPLGPLADLPIRCLDELASLAGTWEGCVRGRTAEPLLPSWTAPGGP